MKKTGKIILGTVAAFAIIGGCSAAVGGSDEDPKPTPTSAAPSTPKPGSPTPTEPAPTSDDPEPTNEPTSGSEADKFRACIQKNGMAEERAAGTHVTKVQGSEEQNDILDAAEIWTNYSGGMMGPDAGKGKILASAFADCYDSKNGMVTVYDKDGEILAVGQY